jgi:preprotein translocase subunit SecA
MRMSAMALNTTILPASTESVVPTAVVPSATWQMLSSQVRTEPLPQDVDAIWDGAKGYLSRLTYRTGRYLARARRVVGFASLYKNLSDARLREMALDYRAMFRTGKDTPKDILKAVALIREVAARTRQEEHYLVQVAGALAMLDGCVAEMATGEGKTLTASLVATVAGWRGRGCHVITVNDYLAKRDAEAMGVIYNFCGLTVGYVQGDTKPPQRRAAYHCDITYCTNKEVCADFLRDRLALGRLKDLPSALLGKMLYKQGTDRVVMRGLAFAIVDEADSVLIDESVTPLIISGDAPNEEQVETFKQAADIAARLVRTKDYTVNPRYREVELTDPGFERVMELSEHHGGLWNGARRAEELVTQALQAREFYLRGKQYVVARDKDEMKVVIVDEFTGRLMPDRTWREGLHQAVEAKEQITINPPKDTFARISFQRFFRSYKQICGMTGTGEEARRELWQIYHLPVVLIPPNKKNCRVQYADAVYPTEDAKYAAIVAEIQRLHATGQPVLIGTRSVKNSEKLSEMLTALGLEHQVLNAVRHAEEAQIIAMAGGQGKITVATNMAGRGTDIKLSRGVVEVGGLAVIATERHESGRVDRQLFGRAARQGDPGRAQAFVALDDELVLQHAPRLGRLSRSMAGAGTVRTRNPLYKKLFLLAQNKAQRQALGQRRSVLKSDDWMDESLGFAGTE